MKISGFLKSKKAKDILFMIAEILIIAAIIFGTLMFIQKKISTEAKKSAGQSGSSKQSESTAESAEKKNIDKYQIEVSIADNKVIIYQYAADKKSREAVKVFYASIGKKLSKGSYSVSNTYEWLKINGAWHRYNTQFGDKAWFQSADYKDRYGYAMKKTSYRSIGKKSADDSCILLYARDAKWILDNCKEGTVVKIIKKSFGKDLKISPSEVLKTTSKCGWDPTDTDTNNPYKKAANAQITTGSDVVYVEKGDTPEYLSNIIAMNSKGLNITSKLKYKEISTNETGTFKVKYSCKTKDGKSLKAVQKFKVIDTTPPELTCSKENFELEIEIKKEKDLRNNNVKKQIEQMVYSAVSCNESGCEITVNTVDKDELITGKIPVIIKAKDKSGNIGSLQVICEIKAKEEETTKSPAKKKKERESKTAAKKAERESKKAAQKAEKESKKAAEKNKRKNSKSETKKESQSMESRTEKKISKQQLHSKTAG